MADESEREVRLRMTAQENEMPNRVCCALTVLHSLRPPAALAHGMGFPDLPEAEQRMLNAASSVLVRYLLGEETFSDSDPYAGRRSLAAPQVPPPPDPQPQGARL